MKFKGLLFILIAALFSGSCLSGFEEMINESNMAKAALKSVTLSSGSLYPEFRREKTSFEVYAGESVTNVAVNAVPEREDSTIQYRVDGGIWSEGEITIEGISSESIIKLDIKVTSGDGKGVLVYTFNVTQTSITGYIVRFSCPDAQVPPEYDTKVVNYNTAVGTLPVSPGRDSYAFAGWFTAVNGGGVQITKDTLVTGDITVYAYWKAGTSGLTISGGTVTGGNVSGEVVIPDYNGGEKVTAIGTNAFRGLTGITGVTIPESVTTIGQEAFSNCSGLTGVLTLPGSVKSIGIRAFNGCSNLTGISIPESVTTIGNYAFSNCIKLTSITIPGSVTNIPAYAFNGCSSLTGISIPESVTTIGDHAFSDCDKLTSITIPGSVTDIPAYAFNGCSGLKNVTILGGVKTIESSAFYVCTGLTDVTIPASVTDIGANAFYSCSGLTSVRIYCNPAPVTDKTAFNNAEPGDITLYSPGPVRDSSYDLDPWSSFTKWSAL